MLEFSFNELRGAQVIEPDPSAANADFICVCAAHRQTDSGLPLLARTATMYKVKRDKKISVMVTANADIPLTLCHDLICLMGGQPADYAILLPPGERIKNR